MKIILITFILICTHFFVGAMVYYITLGNMERKSVENEFRIGKTFNIIINKWDNADYIAVKNGYFSFDYLDDKARYKLSKYMENHKLKIKPGDYACSQTFTYEDCLAHFSFVP